MPKERIGFIGLGVMGRPMAEHLLRADYALVVHDLVPTSVERLVAAGASRASSSREVASRSDVVITMLPDSADVEAAYLGPDGVFEGLHPGLTLVDMSSISPVVARRLAALAVERGCDVLDAPVSGGETGAVDATLSIMCGGKPEVFQRCRPILEAMGKTVTLLGGPGAGQVCKVCNQLVVAANAVVAAEALVLAQKAGLDPATVRAVLLAGSAQSRALEAHGQRMLDRNFVPGFRAPLMLKDLGNALAAGREYGAPVPMGATVLELVKALVATGHAAEDYSAIVQVVEGLAGTELGRWDQT